jgi:predicted Zn-dependent protease
MLLTEKEAKEIAAKMLSFVKAGDAAVNLTSEESAHLRFARNSFLTSGKREDQTASVTVWIDGKPGSAETSDFEEHSLKEAVELAEQIAKLAPVDPEYLPTLGPQKYKQVHGYAEGTRNVSPASRAKAIAELIRECEKADVIGAGFHQAISRANAFATKNGNFNFEQSTIVSLSATARTPEGSSSGYFARNHFDAARLDTARVSREAIGKAVRGKNAQELEPGAYTVILEPQAVANILGFLDGPTGLDARSAEEGRSAFSASGGKTRIGEQIFDPRINLYSDPWKEELPGSQAAQDGIPAEKVVFVENGILKNLYYSRFWAKKKDQKPTPGPVNLILESSGKPSNMEEMIASTKRGLVVSRFWYIRQTDPRTASVTGLTRDGVWLIEDGNIKHAVQNFRFNQSIIQMLAPGNVELIGPSERVGDSDSASLLPPLKLKQFHFTSKSEAV